MSKVTIVFPVTVDTECVFAGLTEQALMALIKADRDAVKDQLFNHAASIIQCTSIEPTIHASDMPELID